MSRVRRLLTVRNVVVVVVALVVAWLAVVPLVRMIVDTFDDGGSSFTWAAFQRAFGSEAHPGKLILNSLIFAAAATVVSVTLGGALAFLHARTDFRFRRLLFVSAIIPMVVPGTLYTTAWMFLGDPRTGLLNQWIFHPLFGHSVSVYGMGGMVLVQALCISPVSYMLCLPAFQTMDPTLEESAFMCGARRGTVLRTITGPLARPALVSATLLIFVQSLEAFEIPTLLGPQGHVYVLTSEIYYKLNTYPLDYGVAGAYSITLVITAIFCVAAANRATRNARHYQTITGKAFRPRPMPLGRTFSVVASFAFFLYVLVALVAPIVVTVYASLLKFYRAPSGAAFKSMSLANYKAVLDDHQALGAVGHTIVMGVLASGVAVTLAAVAGWVVVRSRIPGRRLLDGLAFSPIVVPGLVLGVSLVFVYLRFPLPIYGTIWILVLAYATRLLPYAMRYSMSAMTRLGAELEEAGYSAGAGWPRVFARIVLPLARGGLSTAFVFGLLVCFREVSSVVLLYNASTETVPVYLWQQLTAGNLNIVAAGGTLLIVLILALIGLGRLVGGRFGLQDGKRAFGMKEGE